MRSPKVMRAGTGNKNIILCGLSNHIVEMEKKANVITREIKKLGMENVIGGEALRARVKLYEATMIQAILFNLEGWGGLLPEEVDKFEGIHTKVLKNY